MFWVYTTVSKFALSLLAPLLVLAIVVIDCKLIAVPAMVRDLICYSLFLHCIMMYSHAPTMYM